MHGSNKELFCETLNSSAGRTRNFSNVNRKSKRDATIKTYNVIREQRISLKQQKIKIKQNPQLIC